MGYGNLVLDPRKATLASLKAAAANGARSFPPQEIERLRRARAA